MERPVIKDMTVLKDMCSPLMKYLQKSCDLYVEIHISADSIKVTSMECFIPENPPTN